MATYNSRVLHDLKEVSGYLGVPADTLRKWESRHAVVAPRRRRNGYRSYDDADLERLRRFAALRRQGLSAGAAARSARRASLRADPWIGRIKNETVAAIGALDRRRLGRVFDASLRRQGLERAVSQVWLPTLAVVGARAHARGGFWIAAEHFASAFLRERLLGAAQEARADGPPALVLAAPAGDRHELGMLAALCRLESLGVGCLYLGADLPQESLTAALARVKARGLALTLTADLARRELRAVLADLRRRFPRLRLYVCGQASPRHANLIRDMGAAFLGTDLPGGTARIAAELAP